MNDSNGISQSIRDQASVIRKAGLLPEFVGVFQANLRSITPTTRVQAQCQHNIYLFLAAARETTQGEASGL